MFLLGIMEALFSVYRKSQKCGRECSLERKTSLFCKNLRYHLRGKIHPTNQGINTLPYPSGKGCYSLLHCPDGKSRFCFRKNDFPTRKPYSREKEWYPSRASFGNFCSLCSQIPTVQPYALVGN